MIQQEKKLLFIRDYFRVDRFSLLSTLLEKDFQQNYLLSLYMRLVDLLRQILWVFPKE